MNTTEEQLKILLDELKEKLKEDFAFVIDTNEMLKEFDDLFSTCRPEYLGVFQAFKDSIHSIGAVAILPVTLSFERAVRGMHDDIYRRERILSGKLVLTVGDEEKRTQKEIDKIVIEKTTSDFNERIKSTAGVREIWVTCLQFIHQCAYHSLSSRDFLSASKELLNQSLLLIWSALEVLSRSFFTVFLNMHPEKVSELTKNASLSRHFDSKSVPTETLLKYNFDLTKNMGNILIENFDFSNIDITKAVFKGVLNEERLNKSLKDKEIRKLYMRRNIIVHKSGMVDEKYLNNTDDKYAINEKIYITPSQLKLSLTKVIEVATAMISNITPT